MFCWDELILGWTWWFVRKVLIWLIHRSFFLAFESQCAWPCINGMKSQYICRYLDNPLPPSPIPPIPLDNSPGELPTMNFLSGQLPPGLLSPWQQQTRIIAPYEIPPRIIIPELIPEWFPSGQLPHGQWPPMKFSPRQLSLGQLYTGHFSLNNSILNNILGELLSLKFLLGHVPTDFCLGQLPLKNF